MREALLRILPKNVTNIVRWRRFRKNMRGFSRGHKFFHKEMDTIGNVLRKPSVCLDIGANYGLYSYFLSKLNHENKIIAFEPISSSFWVLKKTLSHFRLKNVHPVKIALDSERKKGKMVIPQNTTGLAYVSNTKPARSSDLIETVEIDTLDNAVKTLDLKKIDFIKCDVEGKELDVLRGGKNTIKKLKPIIQCEIERRHLDKYGFKDNAIPAFLKPLGYKRFFIAKDGGLLQVETTTIPETDFFFIPEHLIRKINKKFISQEDLRKLF